MTRNSKPNPKPFWKEPSLKHVWARANTGAKIMCYAFAYLVVCVLFARFVSEIGALWVLGCGIGFVFGWVIHDLSIPRYVKDEYGEYQEIEFPGEDQ